MLNKDYIFIDSIIIETAYKKVCFESEHFSFGLEGNYDELYDHYLVKDMLSMEKQIKEQKDNDSLFLWIDKYDYFVFKDVKYIHINKSTHQITKSNINRLIQQDFYGHTEEEVKEIMKEWEV
ncbi:hypothetical protein KYI13_03825 [Macrococcoides bohemicum]|uniref:hypothetical protein n=1 Tax=Macrococcoides bohemicum TaxID=1903056 RepID=UPI001C5E4CA6|nr:hypothetical protein [Macrococcus bohemicus]QYA45459.1 hypothetical protein KYI13_03825 [Macrococcus bohemicus]